MQLTHYPFLCLCTTHKRKYNGNYRSCQGTSGKFPVNMSRDIDTTRFVDAGYRIIQAMKNRGMSEMDDLAHSSGMAHSTIRKAARGEDVTERSWQRLAETLRVSVEWLKKGEGSPPEPLRNHDAPQGERRAELPLYGAIPAGPPMMMQEAPERYEVLAHQAREGRYVLRVWGDSMKPDLLPNDLVLMEAVRDADLQRLSGRVCAVLLDGESTLKHVDVQPGQIGGQPFIVLTGGRDSGFKPLVFPLGSRDFRVQGVVVCLVERRFN